MKHCIWVIFVLSVTNIFGSPRVIKDNRIGDLGVTPNLGRGYGLTNNSYHSMCFSTIKTTTPSFDVKYDFLEIDDSYLKKITKTGKLEDSFLNSFLLKHVDFSEKDHTNNSDSSRGRRNERKEVKVKNILIHISTDSFYNAINESLSEMDSEAKQLILNGDLVKFYEVCGFYYIRALGRHSSFMALLKYQETKDSENNALFKEKLKRRLYSFNHQPREDKEFSKEIYKRKLRINVEGIGLGKGDISDLLPTNISELKKTVNAAAKLMQATDAGVVTSMEISPWHENIDFLQAEEDDKSSINKNLFRETKNLQENNAVIAEIERINEYQMNYYYKSYNCLRILEEEYKEGTSEFEFDPDKTFFFNLYNKTNKKLYKSLRNLKTFINQTSIENIYESNTKFLYGDPETKKLGATKCLDEIYEKGIKKVSYHQIPACMEVMTYKNQSYYLIDHYCLPEMVPL